MALRIFLQVALLGLVLARPQLDLGPPRSQPLSPPQQASQGFNSNISPPRPSAGSTARPVAILEQSREFQGDGVYRFSYSADNGIKVQEESSLLSLPTVRGSFRDDALQPSAVVVSRGSFSYTAPDGTPINLSYVADHNGFQPSGAHLPTPPPIPEAIQRALASLPRQQQEEPSFSP
ncbi:hypothetical protein B566_EDAN014193 [Ephemera danica]|nr:hypothetical protein B566_EDAN014193 [Ephemera danica]